MYHLLARELFLFKYYYYKIAQKLPKLGKGAARIKKKVTLQSELFYSA